MGPAFVNCEILILDVEETPHQFIREFLSTSPITPLERRRVLGSRCGSPRPARSALPAWEGEELALRPRKSLDAGSEGSGKIGLPLRHVHFADVVEGAYFLSEAECQTSSASCPFEAHMLRSLSAEGCMASAAHPAEGASTQASAISQQASSRSESRSSASRCNILGSRHGTPLRTRHSAGLLRASSGGAANAILLS